MIKRSLPLVIAVSFGLLTLIGLLLPLPELSDLILGWVTFLAAFALLLGILNLFVVHLNRLFSRRLSGQNLYSGILILSMLAVFALAINNSQAVATQSENGVTTGVATVFTLVQAPLEAAVASLLAFFLLFAGFRLLQRQRSLYSVLFLLTTVLLLLSSALATTTLLPPRATSLLQQTSDIINNIFVTAGMRGILIGAALGAITLSLRLLTGLERPYNK